MGEDHVVEFSDSRFTTRHEDALAVSTAARADILLANFSTKIGRKAPSGLRMRRMCPRRKLPPANKMKILVFSDIHGDMRALEKLVRSRQIFISRQEISPRLENQSIAAEKCSRRSAKKSGCLPGNHESHDDTRELCRRFGFVDFHRQSAKSAQPPGPASATATSRRSRRRANTRKPKSSEALSVTLTICLRFISSRTCRRKDSQLDEFAPGTAWRQPDAARMDRTQSSRLSFLRAHSRMRGPERSN